MSRTGLVVGRALDRLNTLKMVRPTAMINHGLATKARHRGGRRGPAVSVFTGRLVAAPSALRGCFPRFPPLPARLNGMAVCLEGIRVRVRCAFFRGHWQA